MLSITITNKSKKITKTLIKIDLFFYFFSNLFLFHFLEECQNPVRFEGNVDSSLLPLFTLPAPQGVIGSKANILWHEAKIKLIPSVGARCNISGVYYLKDDRLWQEAAPSLFYIDWFDDNARLYVS